jgi:type IV secretory pathway VirD2 relaxase
MVEDPFNIKLGRIFSPNGTGKFVSFANRIRRAARSQAVAPRSRRKAATYNAEQYFSRRAIIKVSVVKMGKYGASAQRHHLNYIGRDTAGPDGKKGHLYSRDEIMTDEDIFYERGKDDPHQFRIIVSPEDAHELQDLKIFTRDLMGEMEIDLETKLDWVAANHYDTSQPHTHIVLRGLRDDGQKLIIPRDYISYGMRDVAEELLTNELGPIKQIHYAQRVAKQIRQERFTSLDRKLLNNCVASVVDLRRSRLAEMDWQNRFESQRVKFLNELGLAEKLGSNKWRLDENLEGTLRRMGERGDIIKTYQRVMTEAKLKRKAVNEPIYDSLGPTSRPITGRVIKTGVLDDVNNRSYMVLDTLGGEALFVETGGEVNIEGIVPGMIVKAGPQSYQPKQSDYTIAQVASKRGGVYSPSAHELSDPSASEEYIQAHVRRLEAMRRAGHVERNSDGSWRIPKNYLKHAVTYEQKRGFNNPAKLDVVSKAPLRDLTDVIGRTWLDEQLCSGADEKHHSGFGDEVNVAKAQRERFLLSKGLIEKEQSVTEKTLKSLEQLDLTHAGKSLSRDYDKPYGPAPKTGKLSGIYRKAIDRPSGKYAVIEKSKEFTLVPWRETMDRNLGKSVTGIAKGQTISWTLTKGRGIS